MDWLLYVVAVLFFLVGAVCVLSVVIQLPGTWIMLALAVLIEWADRVYLSQGAEQTFGWWVLGVCLGLALLGEVIEFLASAVGAKTTGASTRGVVGRCWAASWDLHLHPGALLHPAVRLAGGARSSAPSSVPCSASSAPSRRR